MKKLLSLVLALLMVLSLVACAKTEAPKADAPAADAPAADAPAADAPAADAPAADAALEEVVLSMNVLDAEKHGKHARNEYVKEKFNLTFDYIPVSWGDWNEKIQTWIATDDAPDLINWDLKAASSTLYFDWASQGAFAPITEAELANYPHLLDFYKTSGSVAAYKVDGELYTWPSSRQNPPEIDNAYTSYLMIRADLAKQVGLYQEDNEYTWDEFKTLVQAVKDAGLVTAGLAVDTWAFPNVLTFLNGPAAEGNETCSYIIDEATGLYVWPAATEAYKAAVVETYDWYQKGLIDPDNISFTGSEAGDKFKAGLTFAAYNVAGSMNSWSTDMIRDGIIADRDALRPAIVYGMDGKWYMTQTEDYWTVTSFNYKIEDVKKERALMFWEYLWTDEGILLRWLGVPGKDYNKTGDGLKDVEILWEYDEATGTYISPYVNDSFNEANGACNTPAGNPAEIQYQEDLKQIVWSAMGAGKATMKPVDYNMAVFQGAEKSKYGTFGADAKEAMTIILANPNCDPAAEWDKFVESMMPRVQPVLDELNTGLLGK